MIEFMEPHITGGTSTIHITEEDAIKHQRQFGKYKSDDEALDDFLVIHYGVMIDVYVKCDECDDGTVYIESDMTYECPICNGLGEILK